MSRPKPLILIILDGWGYRAETKANAIALARKPTYDRLLREYPNTLIHTSGPFVGLPEGQMGNSEVGHLNIGAGRIVHMDITRIDLMIQNGEFFSHPVLLAAMKHARVGERRLHLFGLLSDGGVHSQQAHLYALLKMAKQNGVDRVFVHAFMDGRDTLPTNGAGYLEQLQQKMREYNSGKIATVNGRYYAMDRDRRWERIAKAYNAMVFADAEGGKYSDPVQGMKDSYNKGVTDEFVIPFVCTDKNGQPLATIRDDDACICFNFRADRVRQITRALARNSGLECEGRQRSSRRGRSRCYDSARSRSEESALRLHDAVRQEFQPAGRDSAGIDGEHFGERDGRLEHAQPARRRDREVCPRYLFFQWRSGAALSRRRARDGAIAKSCDLRLEARNERCRHRRRC